MLLIQEVQRSQETMQQSVSFEKYLSQCRKLQIAEMSFRITQGH